MTAVLREVRLYGALGRRFGRLFRLAVTTPAEAAQALCAVLPGFRAAFVGADGQARYHVFVGAGAKRRDIGEAEVDAPVGVREPIRIVPVVQGAKRGGVLQTIVGAVLIVAGYYFNSPQLVQVGVAMVLGGVIQLLSPQPKKRDQVERETSYAFDGPSNVSEQGGPVPLCFGRVVCGSVVVSQGITSVQVQVAAPVALDPQPLPDWYWESP